MIYHAKFDSSVSDITKLAPFRTLTVGEVHHLFVPVYDALHAENFVKICPNVMEQSSSQLFTITRTQTDRQRDRQTVLHYPFIVVHHMPCHGLKQ